MAGGARTSCGGCGVEYLPWQRFCGDCGRPVASGEDVDAPADAASGEGCPKCGRATAIGMRFCHACGASLDDVPETTMVEEPAPRRVALPLVLFAATLVTTTLTGAVFAFGYSSTESADSVLPAWTGARYLGMGFVLFTVPLLAILGAHELGHYLALRRLGIPSSFPAFIPFLPFPYGLSGTMGAVIGTRARIVDKRAMVQVAAAGPLVGLVAAVVVLVVGFALSDTAPLAAGPEDGGIELQVPLLYDWVSAAMGVPASAAVHPVAVAGWFGLFITSLQLVPVGQFDGGHMLRAFLGRHARVAGFAVAAAIALVGAIGGFYSYVVWAAIGVYTELRAPREATGRLGGREIALTLACVATFAVTFALVPLRL